MMPVGVPGELYAGGDGVADGYLNRPDLTEERFLPDPFDPRGDGRMYRTGDLVRWLPDGTLEFLGRIDNQVKIRGFRVELGEIESRLREHPSLRDVVVIAFERDGPKRLAAYVVADDGAGGILDPVALRDFVRETLPEYMVPSFVIPMEELPVTSNGKIDRKALPDPLGGRGRREEAVPPEAAEPGRGGRRRESPPEGVGKSRKEAASVQSAATRWENTLSQLWSRLLGLTSIGPNEGFFDLGGTSLLSLEVLDQLSRDEGVHVPVVQFYQYPTVRSLAQYLAEEEAKRVRPERKAVEDTASAPTPITDDRVAVVGMAGRFPGAGNVEAFWHMLREGRDGRVEYSEEELRAAGVPEELIQDPDYVRASYPLDGAGDFDSEFFGYRKREVELMDPQQRLFLELAWSALEHAGYDPKAVPGRVGVFGGVGRNSYLINNLATRPELAATLAEHPGLVGNERDFLPAHVSFRLGFTGPSINVQSACSTSGVALHQARRSLQNRECDVALAGGCKVIIPNRVGYLYEEGGALSKHGRIRAFDEAADGMVRGSGGAMLVLKRYEDAVRDGDRILASVLGSAINNDGAQRAGFAAPSPEGQSQVIAAALSDAGVGAEAIDYVETHGTGTSLGDPIEIEGLTRAFRETTDKIGFCGVGSVKSSIGHLDAGATAAGIIKVLLAFQHEELPPSVNFTGPNPHIDFASSPFFVNDRLRPWPRDRRPRRAGVSSFGLGGANAHIVLEEPPQTPPSEEPSRELQLIVLSARSQAALDKGCEQLAQSLDARPEVNLADVAFTLQTGRHRFPFRRTLIARDPSDASGALWPVDRKRVSQRDGSPSEAKVAFLFPGAGSQYLGMGRGLWEAEPVFKEAMARCREILKELHGWDLTELLYGGKADPAALEQPSLGNPAIFSVEYALSELWRSWGVEPDALIGHSRGEYAAAQVAGVLSLEDTLALVSERGRLFELLPPGSMLAIPLPEEEVRTLLPEELSVSVVNRPDQTVVSGPPEAIDAFASQLEQKEIECARVHTAVAHHSPMVEPILQDFGAFVRGIELNPPEIPFISCLTGTWIKPEEATDPDYWVRHLRNTVRFSDGLATLVDQGEWALLEVGPGRVLGSQARQHPASQNATIVSSLRHPKESHPDGEFIL
ncbi:MAG: beta-ketoacyl synthase N-terminal-like domain-containing protein, partial [Gemmatimonadota bacterium]